ncbi:MAG: RHS repeat-associated core domain-containing protein, partial [Rhodocyclaceae bacterium]|nr:RHS repeat-associated core domain-containing protein [Rhodocyclaceae bacterium]
ASPEAATPITRTTTYAYTTINGRSLLTQIDGPMPNGPGGDPRDSDVTRFDWDAGGNFVLRATSPDGFRTEDEHDDAGRVRSRRFEDGHRRIETTQRYAGPAFIALQPEHIARSAWMLRDGQPLPRTRIDQVLLQARFDPLGRHIRREGSDGTVQSLEYDTAGRPVKLQNGAGEQQHWAYDADGRMLAQVTLDAQGKISDGRLWLRDELGRLRATLTPDGIERIHAYLDEGLALLKTRVDTGTPGAREPRTESSAPTSRPAVLHDDFGREVWQSHPEDGDLVTRYTNKAGYQLQTQIQRPPAGGVAAPIEEVLVFDHAGRLVERQRQGCTETLRYEGTLLMHLQGCGSAHRFERDAFGLITTHHQEQQGDPGQMARFTLRYDYDSAGRLRTRTLANGQVLSYGYDNAGRTESVHLQRTWLRALEHVTGDEAASALTSRLPEHWLQRSVVTGVRRRPFDTGLTALQELIHGNGEGQQWVLPRASRVGSVTAGFDKRDPFERDAYGRQTRHTPASGLHRGIPLQLVWNDAHQLVEVRRTQSGVLISRYRYDSLGNRVAKTVFDAQGRGHTTRYVYDTAHRLVAQANEGGEIAHQYLYADHRAHSMLEGAALHAVHSDWRGLPGRVSDGQRREVWRGSFDAWGATLAQSGETMPLRLAGQQWDAETGLHYNIHRYYDPSRGRYLSPDPMGAPDGPDRYAYLNGNPYAGIDPLGLFEIPLAAFGGARVLPVSDGGHGDIVRIAFAQYNTTQGLRFSQAIIDQMVLNNYHTDSQSLPLLNPGGGQGNPSNHFDNPNNGPVYVDRGSGGFGSREKLPDYRDGVGDDYIQDAINQLNANRMSYQNATFGNGSGFDISRILSAFGQNSHALADFYAHTNWVDGPSRGGCVANPRFDGSMERGYVPIGLAQTRTWDEDWDIIAIDSLYSGTVNLLVDNYNCVHVATKPGDISCTKDKTTHGYWNKDDDGTLGGGAPYTGPPMFGWRVQEYDGKVPEREDQKLTFGTEWHADPGVAQADLKVGDRIYVQVPITTMHQLAFHLAVEHTRHEIARLYKANAGHSIGGIALHDIFKMDAEALAQGNIHYDTRHSKR